jgi:hypothetical protein
VTRDVFETLLATCSSGRLTDMRDAALLLVAFASDGRRRSEVASLRVEQLVEEKDVLENPRWPNLGCLALPIAPSWPDQDRGADADARVLLAGRGVAALRDLAASAGLHLARASAADAPVKDKLTSSAKMKLLPEFFQMKTRRLGALLGT